MSKDRLETIDDIINEKRTTAREIRSGTPNQYGLELAVMLEAEADRIEAAWKREREAGAEAAQICGNIGEMIGREAACKETVTDCHGLGKAAAMREALEKADAALSLISKSSWFVDANFAETIGVIEAGKAIQAALSAPPRNCDRFANANEALEAFEKEKGETLIEFVRWLFAEAKGDAK